MESQVLKKAGAVYSILVETSGGWVPIAERRNFGDACRLAQAATDQSHLYVVIRRGDEVLQEFAPPECGVLSATECVACGSDVSSVHSTRTA